MLADFGRFVAVSALVIVTPGQDTALVIRNTLAAGRRGGVFSALGVASGQAAWTLAVGAGLTALLAAWGPAFTVIRLAGAATLVGLGLWSLIRACSRGAPVARSTPRPTASLGRAAAFSQGLFSALGNPKLAVFFASLFPQFMPHGPVAPAALAILGLTFCLMTLAWLTGYAFVLGSAGAARMRPGGRRVLEAVMGAALVAFGIHMATERR